jgi:hypothetical protein
MICAAWALLSLAPAQDPDSLPLLGTNLAPIEERTTQWPFIDVVRVSTGWVSVDGRALDVDSAGNLLSLADGRQAELRAYTEGHHPLGPYTLTWKGTGEFAAGGGSRLDVTGPGSGILTVSEPRGIVLRMTKADSSDPPRDVRLWMPGFGSDVGPMAHHPVFLQRMGLYRVLRFADWTRAGDPDPVDWSRRATRAHVTFAKKGVPYETALELCADKNAVPWVSVPLGADDGHVAELAKMAFAMTRPSTRVIVEYGDEAWDSRYAQERGLALKLADDPRLAGLRFSAQRSSEVFAIFEREFAGRDRLVRVWSGPLEDPPAWEEALSWNGFAKTVDAVSVRAQFGQEVGKAGALAPTDLDSLFGALFEEIETKRRILVREAVKHVRLHRKLLVSHRAGQALVSHDRQDEALDRLMDEANRDDRMREAYVKFFQMWRDEGGSLVVHNSDCSPLRRDGRWGALEHQSQDSHQAPKHRGLIEYALFSR